MPETANYGALLDSCAIQLPCGLCSDDSWQLLYANARLRNLMNIRESAIQGDSLKKWLDGGSLEEIKENPRKEGSGRALLSHQSGNEYLISWWRLGEEPATPLYFRCFTVQQLPFTLLKKTCLHELKELDSILDFIHDGIWVIDGNGITRRINRAMERIAGIRAEEVVGRHVSEPLREGRFKTCVSLRALQTRHTVTLFDDYANGKRCLNTSTPVFDEKGNVWRVIAAIRDITELETLQKKLSDLEVEALAYRLRVQGLESESQSGILGQSPILQRIMQDIGKAAQTDATTLILGETGTGKSLAARTIHELSARAQKPFVAVNCGAIPASLMESELFGYEKGAFTGAARGGKPGMLELASGGTLLLDEIGELSLPLQAKLLHMLDGEPIFRVGGTRPIAMDARIIAATNRSLAKMVAAGKFREDLFYRLRVLCVQMPPLRDRKDDILLLTAHFLKKISKESGIVKKLDPRVEKLFLAYSWPGNVRELQSVIQSLTTLCENEWILPADLPSYMRESADAGPRRQKRFATLTEAVENLEKTMLAEALAESGSTYKAARRLGISQSSVVRKAKKYGLGNPDPARRLPGAAEESEAGQEARGDQSQAIHI